jgi:PAS domain S-box-containing protein
MERRNRNYSVWIQWVLLPFFLGATLYFIYQNHPEYFQFTFNIYGALSIAAAIGDVVIMVLFSRLKTKTEVTVRFSYFTLLLFVASLGEGLGRLGAVPDGSSFWHSISGLAQLVGPAMFALFTFAYIRRSDLAKNAGIMQFLGLTTLAFVISAFNPFLSITTSGTVNQTPWGFAEAADGPIFSLISIWVVIIYTTAIVLLVKHYLQSRLPASRKQTLFVLVATAIPVFIGGASLVLQPVLGHAIPPLGPTLTSISAILISFAMLRSNLFVFNPATVATNILDTMQEAIVVVNKDFVVEFTNNRADSLFGFGKEGLVGSFIQPLFIDQNQIIQKKLLIPLSQHKIALLEEASITTAQGQRIPVSVTASPFLDEAGQSSGYIMAITDITVLEQKVEQIREQKNALTVLSEQLRIEKASVERKVVERTQEVVEGRARLLASINSLELGFIMTDSKLSVTLMNSAAVKMIWHQKEGVTPAGTGQLPEISMILTQGPTLIAQTQQVIATRRTIKLPNISFGSRIVDIFISPIMLRDDTLGTVTLIQDITEAKILERSKDEFFTIASHELRTPLTVIKNNIALIKKQNETKIHDDLVLQASDLIQGSATRLIDLVHDFLDTSMLEQGKMTFTLVPVDLVKIVNESFTELAPLAAEKHNTLSISQSAAVIPPVKSDPQRLKEVLINLLGNSIKFTENGSIAVGIEVAGQQVTVRIRDTGRGIPVANQSLLFHKFQQAGDSLTVRDTAKGTGLGLYISKMLIEGMGGTIKLENSVPGKGTSFVFTLDRA